MSTRDTRPTSAATRRPTFSGIPMTTRIWYAVKRMFWTKSEASHYWFTPSTTEGSI